MRNRIHAIMVSVGLLAALCACGLGGGKASECNKLIEVMNKGAENVRKAVATGDTNTADLEKMATSMEDVADKIGRLQLTNADLRKKADDFAANARALARASRDIAAGLKSKDFARVTAAKAARDKAAAAEPPLVNDINSFCQAH